MAAKVRGWECQDTGIKSFQDSTSQNRQSIIKFILYRKCVVMGSDVVVEGGREVASLSLALGGK
jgi:hypothetical protein